MAKKTQSIDKIEKKVKKRVKKLIIEILVLLICAVLSFILYKVFGNPLDDNTTTAKVTTTQKVTTTRTKKIPTGNYLDQAVFTNESTHKCDDDIVENIIYESFQIHFLELGVYNTGDCTYIKAGDTDILIDAGAIAASATTIEQYVNQYCTDGILEYVIVTHAHSDHWSGMFGNTSSTGNYKDVNYRKTGGSGIFYYYQIGTIIDFSRTSDMTKYPSSSLGNTTDGYKYYQALQNAINNGAKHYTAEECFNNTNGAQNEYVLDDVNDIRMSIMYNKYYFESSTDENNHSVCTMFSFNNDYFLLTGDLEEGGEQAMANYYDESTPEKTLPHVKLFKAGHHGSPTSSNDCLLDKITPEICCVCCCAGSTEYTTNMYNTFPSQEFVNRIAKHTERVYVTSLLKEQETRETNNYKFTSMNGSICVSSNGEYTGLYATNNLTKLKDSTWFNEEIYVIKDGSIYNVAGGSGSGASKHYYNSSDSGAITRVRRTWPTS